MANKQISDLQARTFDGDSIIPHDVENTDPSTMSQKPYLTGSATGHAVADFVGNGEEFTTDLDTVDKHLTGAINELNSTKQDTIIPTVLNNNLTYHANCSIQNGFIIQYGRLIEVGMILKATGNINNNDIIVSGLPRALQNRRCPRGLGTDQWYANTDYTSGGLAVDIDENDQTKAIIRNFSNITASSSSPKYIYMSFSYVTMN